MSKLSGIILWTAASLLTCAAPLAAAPFRRGDSNADGEVNLADAVATLRFLFQGGLRPTCHDAADANDDGSIDIADAVRTLARLYFGGPALPGPADVCGADATADALDCRAFAPCSGAPASAILLNEVLARPLGGEPELADVRAALPALAVSFVELRVAVDGASPSGARLRAASGAEYTVPAGIEPLPAGAIFLIVFDGRGEREGRTLHADRNALVDPDSDALELIDAGGAVLDRAAWGLERPDAVVGGQGGVIGNEPQGTTYSRLPGAGALASPDDWVVTGPRQATPGEPNRHPGADLLIPPDGAVLEAGEVFLDWYPVPGASGYEIVLSRSPDLSAPLLQRTVGPSQPVSAQLQPSAYYWQVVALDPLGAPTDPSTVRAFRVVENLDDPESVGGGGGAAQEGATLRRTLPREPPLYNQRKDTRMLLLEADGRTGTARAWDAPHAFDRDDPACNSNCALATISMANGYLSGAAHDQPSLSQDRIGLEVHSSHLVLDEGPELDFNFGRGLSDTEYEFGLSWALQATVTQHYIGDQATTILSALDIYPASFRDELWAALRQAIDLEDRPVPISAYYAARLGSKHAMLAWGYQETANGRFVLLNDPWMQGNRYWIDLSKLRVSLFFELPHGVSPRADEEDLRSGVDSDGDRILDFDERMRFETRYQNPRTDKDTDGDCIDDYEEVRRSVFHDSHGWGRLHSSQQGDGKARDGARPELDLDSDGGGLPDFVEDRDQDGELDGGEGDPYDPGDDRLRIDGTIEHAIELSCPSPGPGFTYHDLTHIESSTATFRLEAMPGADRKGTLHGTVSFDFDGLRGFWVSDSPGDCGETGLSRTVAPFQWAGRYEGRLVCRPSTRGPELHLEAYVPAGETQLDPPIHEHFCDLDFDARPNVAPARATDLDFLTWYFPGGTPKPIEGSRYENTRDFKMSGCYTGTIRMTVRFDIAR